MMDPDFWQGVDPFVLREEFGTPLYVTSERIFRRRIREIKRLVTSPHYAVHYSVKANSCLKLLKIAHEEGLQADAMSPGEMFLEEKAGFSPAEILFIADNVSVREMEYAVRRGILVSLDSLSQLERFGRAFPGHSCALRVNTGIGAGHSSKVITGGAHTKFGILTEDLPKAREIARQYDLSITGLNQHIGSFFLNPEPYLEGVRRLMQTAMDFPDLTFLDCGGGFGIPYQPQTQHRLDLTRLGEGLATLLSSFEQTYPHAVTLITEPGRYLAAESTVLLGTVEALKENAGTRYVGTDIGFNVFMRPVLYGSYHEIETYPKRAKVTKQRYTIVGNICESGDILAEDRLLPEIREDDLLVVHDTGAYGYSMASNYNARLLPAEVLITEEGKPVLIRRRQTLEDLLNLFPETGN